MRQELDEQKEDRRAARGFSGQNQCFVAAESERGTAGGCNKYFFWRLRKMRDSDFMRFGAPQRVCAGWKSSSAIRLVRSSWGSDENRALSGGSGIDNH
jgi:hypothetical protein